MNERLKIKQRLKDDFVHYAQKCLKIRTKSGSIEPLVLNKAQLYIHSQLQKQLGETGKVRALVLKSRQQGCCYTPEMKVLTADYRWVPLHAIQIGDELIGVDENLLPEKHSAGRRYSRKLRTSIVEAKAELLKPVFKVYLDNGTTIEVTGEHRHLCRKRATTDTQWREINKTKVGDYIRYISPAPSESDDPYEDGWFGGILDGEGTLRQKTGLRLSFCQIDNVVLKRAKAYLKSKNIKYYENIDTRQPGSYSKFGAKAVHCIAINRFADALEILSKCRPSRFVNKRVYDGHELPGKAIKGGNHCWAKVTSITPIGKKKVIDLQTSTKTYICEGLVSHNSTYIGARFYHKATWHEGMQAFIMAHSLDATNNLYKMAQRFYEHTPNSIKIPLVKSNSKELIFDWIHSGYKLGTAENKNVGRSSTIQLLHASELAFWSNTADHAMGIMQAVPNVSGTEVIFESTPNGVGNYFHIEWQKAEAGISDYIAIFVPWYWQDEYAVPAPLNFKLTAQEDDLKLQYNLTDDQINWRRKKIIELSVNGIDGEKSFKQEYSSNANEAFILTGEDSFINSDIVVAARHTVCDKFGPLLVGVDPARFGDDRTSIIFRQGRVAYGLQSYVKKDLMETAGIVHRIIEEHAPAKVFIDVGGLGAGVLDRLRELGHGADRVVGVNAGSAALDGNKYKNKRAEMWGLMKEWLMDAPVQIPDENYLHADLCGIKYKFDSNSRLQMEAKEDMKKRGIRSPDTSEALAQTFAYPESALNANNNQSDVLNSLAESFTQRQAAVSKSRR